VLDGSVVTSPDIDYDVVWRAGLAAMADGSMALAVMQSSMDDFARALQGAGAVQAGYTDGGGSAALVTPDGVAGSSEGRRVATWLTVGGAGADGGGASWLEATLVAVAVGTGAWYLLRHRRML
jgi:hypothetical protein